MFLGVLFFVYLQEGGRDDDEFNSILDGGIKYNIALLVSFSCWSKENWRTSDNKGDTSKPKEHLEFRCVLKLETMEDM